MNKLWSIIEQYNFKSNLKSRYVVKLILTNYLTALTIKFNNPCKRSQVMKQYVGFTEKYGGDTLYFDTINRGKVAIRFPVYNYGSLEKWREVI